MEQTNSEHTIGRIETLEGRLILFDASAASSDLWIDEAIRINWPYQAARIVGRYDADGRVVEIRIVPDES